MPLRMAETEGLVRRDPATGEYVEVDQAGRQAAVAQERAEAEAQIKAEASFPVESRDSDEFLSDLHRAMTANGVSPDAAIITAYTNPEQFIAQILPRIVAQGGNSADVWDGIQASFEATQQRVAALCQSEGVNANAFFEYLESGQIPRSRWIAAGLQALGGEARPFRALIREFKALGVYHTRGVEVPRGPGRPGE